MSKKALVLRMAPQRASHSRRTNRSEEAKRFSTVRPVHEKRHSELNDVMAKRSAKTLRSLISAKPLCDSSPPTTTTADESASFDPIATDGMFWVPASSKHWPPPTSTGPGGGDLDQYDRRSAKPLAAVPGGSVPASDKIIKPPRGKVVKSTLVTFSD